MIDAAALETFATAVFARSGLPERDAATVAKVLVWANLRGMDSHGVMRIPRYVELIQAGDMNPTPRLTVATESPASVLLDCDRAAGPVAMSAAMEHAIRKARDAGIGLALVRATTHTAAVGYYTTQAAAAGMIGIAVSASWPNMAYHGARAAGASTNPISIAAPRAGGDPVVLDMGTGIVSIGKLMAARKTNTPVPEGFALDKDGNPTTDPQKAAIPLPLGGPKGSGLSLMIELMTSLLVANPLIAETLAGSSEGKRHRQNGAAIAIDVARFGDPAAFGAEVERLAASLKALPRDPDVEDILLPGERGARIRAKRQKDGIPLPPPILKELNTLAEKLAITPL